MIDWAIFTLLLVIWSIVSVQVIRKMVLYSSDHEDIFKKISGSTYSNIVTVRKARRVSLLVIIICGWALIGNIVLVNLNHSSGNAKGSEHLYILLDTSISMNTQDEGSHISRLEKAKQKMGDELKSKYISQTTLVTFHSHATVYPTMSSYEMSAQLDSVFTVPYFATQGSSFGNALNTLALAVQEDKAKAPHDTYSVVLISDGEETNKGEYDVDTNLSKLKAMISQLKVVGVGTESGDAVPYNSYDQNYLRTGVASPVKTNNSSSLNKASLEHIAQLAGGTYLHIDNGTVLPKTTVRHVVLGEKAGYYFYWLCALGLFISWTLYFTLPYVTKSSHAANKPNKTKESKKA